MWTIDEGLQVIRDIQSRMHEMGYHATLGGGVLNNSRSDKDLDLFILRKNNTERKSAYDEILTLVLLWGVPGTGLRDSVDYGPDEDFHFTQAQKFKLSNGRRIDVFVQ